MTLEEPTLPDVPRRPTDSSDPSLIEVGDIVLTKVAGNVYIHLVKAIEPAQRRVQTGNNRGGIHGWTGFDRVYGIAV